MGKHKGEPADGHMTAAGVPFNDLTPQQKGAEFDASHSDATAYAERNFGAGHSNDEQWMQAQLEQRDQRSQRRES